MMAPRGAALADRPEHALLVGCARSVVAAHQAATEWPRGESLDWAYLIAQADRHGVLPLLAGVIASWEASSLPQEPLDELRRRMLALAAHNLSLSVSLRQLVDLLESHAIPVVPFKGPALAVAAFGDVAHRQFDDLDVLVPRKDLQRAIDLLQGAGHRLLNPRLGQQLGAMLRHDKHVLFEHRPSGTLIEVHWALAPRHFGLPLNERLIWESAHRVTVAGRPMRAVPPDVLLLMLCIHGARHEWRVLVGLSTSQRSAIAVLTYPGRVCVWRLAGSAPNGWCTSVSVSPIASSTCPCPTTSAARSAPIASVVTCRTGSCGISSSRRLGRATRSRGPLFTGDRVSGRPTDAVACLDGCWNRTRTT